MFFQAPEQKPQQSRHNRRGRNVTVLIASRRQQDLDQIMRAAERIEGPVFSTRLICNGHCDPLYGLEELPDILIFRAGDAWREELQTLKDRSPQSVPMILVLSEHDDADMLRSAMQAGARDFFIEPFDTDALLESVSQLVRECLDKGNESKAVLTTFMNAKGGAGASLIATNVAHIMAEVSKLNVALIDLDIQFGGLPYYLDLTPKYGIIEAIERVNELDEVAINGFFVKHASGLHVLGSCSNHLEMVDDIEPEKVSKLIALIAKNHDQLIIDLPRHINLLATTVVEQSDQVVIVVQQSLTSLHDAVRLLGFLKRDIVLNPERIQIVVNRFDKKSDITLRDIEKALKHVPYSALPNAYKEVSESIQSAKPLHTIARRAHITKELMKFETHIGGHSIGQPGAISRFFARLHGA